MTRVLPDKISKLGRDVSQRAGKNERQFIPHSVRVTGVIFFGDSIFAGTGASDRQLGCAKLVKSSLSIPVSIRSRNRDTSDIGLRRISEDVLKHREYSHIPILFGNNDCWFNKEGESCVPIEFFERNLRRMVQLIQDNKQTPLLCNLQPIDNAKFFRTYPEYTKYRDSINLSPLLWQRCYGDRIEIICHDLGITLINIRATLEGEISLVLSDDGIHPNDKGHMLIASTVLEQITKLDPTSERSIISS